MTNDARILIHHPAHHLWSSSYIGRGDILPWTKVMPHLQHPAAAQGFFLSFRQRGWIHNDAAFAAAQWNICHSTFPSHPHRECTNSINRLVRSEANAAFIGAARVIVLNAEPLEELQ